MDTHLYLEINRLARETPWAHGVARAFATWAGLAALAVVLLLAYLRARSGATGGGPRQVAAVVWTVLGGAASFGVAQPVGGLLGRTPPFLSHPGALLLLPGVAGAVLPDDRSVVAGAVLLGCLLARDLLAGALAALVGLLLAFDRVYVGLRSPEEVLAGLGFGAVAVLVVYPVAVPTLERAIALVRPTFLGLLVGPGSGRTRRRRPGSPPLPQSTGEPARAGEAGPAARPPVLASTGTVRLLEGRPLAPPRATPYPEGGREGSPGMAGS